MASMAFGVQPLPIFCQNFSVEFYEHNEFKAIYGT